MSQQGGRPTDPVPEDDWWGQLYDDRTSDTGPTGAADSLDDRFASASGVAGEDLADSGGPPSVPGPREGDGGGGRVPADPVADAREPDPRAPARSPAPADDGTGAPRSASRPPRTRAPWERPTAVPGGPAGFPADSGQAAPAPRPPAGGTTSTTGDAAPLPDDSPKDTDTRRLSVTRAPRPVHLGSGPPTYEAEPTTLPPADPGDLTDLVADTVLDGARCGAGTLRAVSVRGDSARYRGEPRRDALLVARFGAGEQALVLVAMATGARATAGAHRAAAEVCRWIGQAVGRSHVRLAEDIRSGRRGDLKSGLHRLTDRSLGRLRAGAAEQGVPPAEYAATLRCLLLPGDPECRTRVFFGVGAGGLFRLRDGVWRDIEPAATEVTGEPVVGFGSPSADALAATPAETPEGDRLTLELGIPKPPSPYEPAPQPPREPFRFRASVARPGDTLLLCTDGLAEPLRGEPELCAHLTERWSGPEAPGLAAFLADTQARVKGYADDRTAAAVWEA
ncbi:protein phosphatase 2C domain-containing protein [Streptomyces sp. NPDC005017]|uniref:protein phosphatase 2C domain-containing protein n=1 Tax=Streptomyces sp. NPDC005017 TaxID=3364706 RepID=UPI0036A2BE50